VQNVLACALSNTATPVILLAVLLMKVLLLMFTCTI
jgi:hypothetical protein